MGNGVLGLFPNLESTGGIQASGALAWDAIMRMWPEQACFFTYGAGITAGRDRDSRRVRSGSKLAAIVAAARTRWHPGLVVVWHIGLLKLLPLFRAPSARVVLVLLGIEAWRRQDPVTQALLRRVDMLFTISDYTWQRFSHVNPRYASAAHRTVHLGIGACLEAATPLPDTSPIALILSRLAVSERYKGHTELINAWPGVLRRIPGAQLWIAGEGPLRSELEHLAVHRGVERSVRFCGWVSENQKQELLKRSRCMLMPSRKEGFGLVYLEAMRLGRPCLVSRSDAGREVVNPPEAGLAVNPGSPPELVDAICRLLTLGSEWDMWSHSARQRYEAYFTAAQFQQRFISALCAGRTPGDSRTLC